ncbi:MAG: carbohydrate porin [Betaproteobacteria bacterium]|nr:MAG: carbohydrate porin [Betaproteobacteria bacterium]
MELHAYRDALLRRTAGRRDRALFQSGVRSGTGVLGVVGNGWLHQRRDPAHHRAAVERLPGAAFRASHLEPWWRDRGEGLGLEPGRTRYAAERFVLTAGNLSVLDVFDVLEYSHDPRTQFMNWSSLTYGAWDFPADARGYTWGVAGEYITPRFQVRAGRFLVPVESNGLRLEHNIFRRYGDVAEFELPYKLASKPAVARVLTFRNRVSAGEYDAAITLGRATATTPDVASVRRAELKQGFGISTQVEISQGVGAYVRAGWSDGKTETFMFTEIDRSLAAGALIRGGAWGRREDAVGAAAYLNALSRPHRDYLAAGGLGFFLGDGRLNYATERILEVFYSMAVANKTYLSLGYQRIANPGYNRDRGPADFFGFRLHAEL